MSRIVQALPAPVPALAGAAGGTRQYLAFTLDGELFAIDILQIREIVGYGRLTAVPMMPPAVRGVLNLRGAVVPVVDLSARFGRAASQAAPRTCIVILEVADEAGSRILGAMVDGVNEVLDLPLADIEPPPRFGSRIRSDFIAGLGRLAGRFVIILDLAKVLAPDEMPPVH